MSVCVCAPLFICVCDTQILAHLNKIRYAYLPLKIFCGGGRDGGGDLAANNEASEDGSAARVS